MRHAALCIIAVTVVTAATPGCSPKPQPPRVCEPPPPEPRGVALGECPIEWVGDAGDDGDADAATDAPIDSAPDGAIAAAEYHPPQ